MPYLTISVTPGLSPEKKTELMRRCSNAVVESIDVQLPSVRVILQELAPGTYMDGGDVDSPGVLIVVDLIEGRTQEKKDTLIAMLSKVAAEVSGLTEERHVRVRLIDFPRGNIGMANGMTALAVH